MRVLAVIPARGGSRGIPRKNLTPLAGRPLIAWTIDAALAAPRVTEVIVSSDDREILRVAADHGASALQRPSELATDEARSEPVLAHALDAMEACDATFDVAVLLQPTSPLRRAEDIETALGLLEQRADADGVISVVIPERSPFKALYYDLHEGGLRPVAALPDAPFRPRQSLPTAFYPNGAIYAVRTAAFRATGRLIHDRTLPYPMPAERSCDIDTPDDLVRCADALTARTRPSKPRLIA